MKMLVLLLLVFLLANCSPKITRYDYIREPIQSNNCEVVICDSANILGIDNEKIGRIKIAPSGFKSFIKDSALQILRREACSVQANFVNIISENKSKKNQKKYVCYADLHNIDLDFINSHKIDINNRDTLIYSFNRKLNWNDFKRSPPNSANNEKQSFLVTTLTAYIGDVNAWLGYGTFKIQAVLFRDISWVYPQYKNNEFLEYQQILFDIAENFALKLQNNLNESKINLGRREKITEIINSYKDQLIEQQKKFIDETEQGENILVFDDWKRNIKEELVSLKRVN